MEIAIHLGAHCTDEDLILRTLAENPKALTAAGVVIPPSGKARPALRRAMQSGGRLLPGTDGPLIGELLDTPPGHRLVLSYEGFLGSYARVLAGPSMYVDAGQRAAMLRDLFAGHEVHFYLALRNPATFVPALFEASSADDFGAFVAGLDLGKLAWSEPVAAIRAACPEVPLTVWCNEDLPLVWPDVLRDISGIDHELRGEGAILRRIMTEEGYRRLRSYLDDNPPAGRSTWRKVVTTFLCKYADEAETEPEIALPGWTEETIAWLSDRYGRDVARLREMDDLRFIAP